MGQWNMHVSSGNATRGYACLGAEGSGHAGNPACTHMRPSSSVQPGGGDGGGNSRSRGNSCGSAGPTDMKGPRVGTAPGPAWEPAAHSRSHKHHLSSLTLGQQLLALRQQTVSVS